MALVESQLDATYRLAKESYGPVNPPLRSATGLPIEEWGRYDVIGDRTVYTGSCEEVAYAESLAHLRPAIVDGDLGVPDLADLFDGEEANGVSLAELVNREWSAAHHMPVGQIAAAWRQERRMNRILLPSAGWFVDIETVDSIRAIRRNVGSILRVAGADDLDTSHLRGSNRRLTTAIAQWIHGVTLDNGAPPLGIVYGSKHDSHWSNWAIWLRSQEPGSYEFPLTVTGSVPIDEPAQNPPLQQICDLFGIRCH